MPTTWKKIAYDRVEEQLVPINEIRRNIILSTVNIDWSRQIISELSVNDLDKNAILKAREQFKNKNENKEIAKEIDKMDDITFLNKAKVLLNGKITRTAWLLLGKEDVNTAVENCIPTITWELRDEHGVVDYEHFSIPFILNIEKATEKIRNLKYRYIPSQLTIFPEEIDKYDTSIIRELVNNAVAHQDYRISGRVNIIEMKDKITIINEGNFIPKSIDNLILNESYVPPYYRNTFLSQAMVNLNLIDTAGMGIRRSFEKLRERYFPMLDYDLNTSNRVKVTIYGKIIDEKYTSLLFENKELTLEQVMLLDRVQKNIKITKDQATALRKSHLIEGRYPAIYISKEISKATNQKAKYIKNAGLDDEYYQKLILTYIDKFGSATTAEIRELLMDKLPDSLDEEQKNRKIKYLISEKLKDKKNLIENVGTYRNAIWKLKKS